MVNLDLAMLPQTEHRCFFRPRMEMLRGVSMDEGGKVAKDPPPIPIPIPIPVTGVTVVVTVGVVAVNGVIAAEEGEGAGDVSIVGLSASSSSAAAAAAASSSSASLCDASPLFPKNLERSPKNTAPSFLATYYYY